MSAAVANVIEQLRCPVCTSYMIPPIRMCLYGHSFCDRCNAKSRNCPICRNSKSGVRNFRLENIFNKLTIPCRNASKGCPIQVRGSALKDHQKSCQYIAKTCPLRTIGNCQWIGLAKDCVGHCFQQHPSNTYGTSKIHLHCGRFQSGQFLRPTEVGKCYHILIQAYGQVFKCMWEMHTTNGLMKLCVVCMDPNVNVDKYYFELVFYNQGSHSVNDNDLFRRSRCQAIKRGVFQDDRCILTNIDLLKMLSGEQGLFYSVSIFELDVNDKIENVMAKEPNIPTRAEAICNSFSEPEPSMFLDLNDLGFMDLRKLLATLEEEKGNAPA